MSSYTAPLSDLRFGLHDVLKVESLFARLGFTDATADVVDAVLEEAGRFSASVLAPLNSVGDEIGCVLDQASGEVTTPPGFKQAYDQFVDGGWTGLTAAPELGGQGLPHTLGVPLNEMINAANLAWGNFPLLSHGAIEALKQHGEAWQHEAFLKPATRDTTHSSAASLIRQHPRACPFPRQRRGLPGSVVRRPSGALF